jgi:hypothetical protein
MGAVLELLRNTAIPWFDITTKTGSFILCVFMGIVFLVILVPAGKLMRINEIQEILIRPIVKIKGRLNQKTEGV